MMATFSLKSFSVRFSWSILLSVRGSNTFILTNLLASRYSPAKRVALLKILQPTYTVERKISLLTGSSVNQFQIQLHKSGRNTYPPTVITIHTTGQKKNLRNVTIVREISLVRDNTEKSFNYSRKWGFWGVKICLLEQGF